MSSRFGITATCRTLIKRSRACAFPAFRNIKMEATPPLCGRTFHLWSSPLKNRHSLPSNELPPMKAEKYSDRLALVDQLGQHTYGDLTQAAHNLATILLTHLQPGKGADLKGTKIALHLPNDASFVVSLWATWLAGSDCVPLHPGHPASLLEYFLADSTSKLVICSQEDEEMLRPVADKLQVQLLVFNVRNLLTHLFPTKPILDPPLSAEKLSERLNRFQQLQKTGKMQKRPALMIYTSGTTGPPKVSAENTEMGSFVLLLPRPLPRSA